MEKEKLPFRRLRRPLEQLCKVALPLHVQQLEQQSAALERLGGGRLEQANACKAVQLLKADLFELEQLNLQVRDEDQEAFHDIVRLPLKEAVEALSIFMSVHADALGPALGSPTSESPPVPQIVCDPDAPPSPDEEFQLQEEQVQLQTQPSNASIAWSRLRSELLEINSLVHKFSALVFAQQAPLSTVQDNVERTAQEVRAGTEHLRRASLMRAASLPLLGAIAGGLLLGPAGAVVGLKLAGCAACAAGGTALGYTAGASLRNRHRAALQAIEYPAAPKES